MTTLNFALVDETKGAKTTSGQALTPTLLTAVASACQFQLNSHLAGFWGGTYRVRTSNGKDIQPGEIVFSIQPTLPTAPGAIAYHDVNDHGVPVAFDAITLSDTITGPGGFAVAISHELCETAGDPGANRWADDGKKTEHALELCDAVEAFSYAVTAADGTRVYVSNFVLPAFFVPNAAGPYDWMTANNLTPVTAPKGPLTTAIAEGGDYQILRTVNEKGAQQVTAKGTPRRRAKFVNWSSRASRRGVPHNN